MAKPLELEHDPTVRSFTNWLAEMKVQNNRTVQDILSETSIIRDSITANNMELTDFKRHSSGAPKDHFNPFHVHFMCISCPCHAYLLEPH